MKDVDWSALERLRTIFLEGSPVRGAYWKSRADLASYDATLGERIGWKWDAVLGELRRQCWQPPRGPLLDFGCGSGIAGRRVLAAFGPTCFSELRLSDKSGLAEAFASERARSEFPDCPVRIIPVAELENAGDGATLVVSHVLSELSDSLRVRLRGLVQRAAAVLWVEPGTHADSHALITMREALRGEFEVVAPCTHGASCGLLAPGNERHWCHFFGRPPWEIFADPEWAEFAARMGVDLRSLPFSYLVLERQGLRVRPGLSVTGCSRVIGAPRFYKGYAKVFGCAAEGVAELTWSKRSAGSEFKALKDGEAGTVFRWQRQGDQIEAVEAVPPRSASREDSVESEPPP